MKKKLLVAVIAIVAIVGVGTAYHMEQSASETYMAQPGRGWSSLNLLISQKIIDNGQAHILWYIHSQQNTGTGKILTHGFRAVCHLYFKGNVLKNQKWKVRTFSS